jgi:hypothetical protein
MKKKIKLANLFSTIYTLKRSLVPPHILTQYIPQNKLVLQTVDPTSSMIANMIPLFFINLKINSQMCNKKSSKYEVKPKHKHLICHKHE